MSLNPLMPDVNKKVTHTEINLTFLSPPGIKGLTAKSDKNKIKGKKIKVCNTISWEDYIKRGN